VTKEEAMGLNVYIVEKLAAVRLDELRAERRRIALLEAVRGPRSAIASGLGVALIRLGRRLAQRDPVADRNAGVRLAR
jgi:hypothetical protein